MLRLVRLGPNVARLARAVAVLERAELDQAARLAGLALPDVRRAADLLVRAGVLTRIHCVSPTHSCVALSIGTWGRLSGPRRTGAPRDCWPKHTPARRGSPSTCSPLLPAGDGLDGRTAASRRPGGGAQGRRRSRRPLTYAGPWPSRRLQRRNAASCWSSAWPSSTTASRSGPPPRSGGGRRPATTGLDRSHRPVAVRQCAAVGISGRPRRSRYAYRVAARLDGRNTEAHLELEAMASGLRVKRRDHRAAANADRARPPASAAPAARHPSPGLLAVAADVAAPANQPADQVADLARRAIAAGPRQLPEPGDSPWLPDVRSGTLRSASIAERYDDSPGSTRRRHGRGRRPPPTE